MSLHSSQNHISLKSQGRKVAKILPNSRNREGKSSRPSRSVEAVTNN